MTRQPQDSTSDKSQKAKADVQRDLDQSREQAAALGEDAKREARSRAEAGTTRAAEEIDRVAGAMDAAASELHGRDADGLAAYVERAARSMSEMSESLRNRSVDELADDASRLARNNPALFLIGGLAVGFGLARFLKASAERDHSAEMGGSAAAGAGNRPSRATGAYGPGTATDSTTGSAALGQGSGMGAGMGAPGAADAGTSVGSASDTIPGAEAVVPEDAMSRTGGSVPETGPTGSQTTDVSRSASPQPERPAGAGTPADGGTTRRKGGA